MENQTETKIEVSPVQLLAAEFAKTGKLVYTPGENMGEFANMLKNAATLNITYKDWTAKAPETFSGVALIQTKDKTENRLIALPDKATALADPVVQDALYAVLIRRIIRTARDDEASEGQFITPSGALSVPFDNDAFAFQSGAWVDILKDMGLKSIQKRSLKLALANAAFAKSSFPIFSDWEKLIGLMSQNAEKHGYSTSLFAHMLATRDAQVDTGKPITLGDADAMAALLAKFENDDEGDEAENGDEAATA